MSQSESNTIANIDRAWALLFARLVLGLIFFMAGVRRSFSLGRSIMLASIFYPLPTHFCQSGHYGPWVWSFPSWS